jgi:hypothetical protein
MRFLPFEPPTMEFWSFLGFWASPDETFLANALYLDRLIKFGGSAQNSDDS